MRGRLLLIVAASLWATAAFGQTVDARHCHGPEPGPNTLAQPILICDDSIEEVSSGNDKLDAAMTICRAHQVFNGQVYATYPLQGGYDYPPAYKACSKVEEKWGKSAEGLAERKRKEQDQRDLDLVNAVAGEK